MSTHYFRLVPNDPYFVPSEESRHIARTLLNELIPSASEITDEVHDRVTFFDNGEITATVIRCPICGTTIEREWWLDSLEGAAKGGWERHLVRPPCCGSESTINDLCYDPPMGWARYSLQVRDPETTDDLSELDLQKIEGVLGCKLRQCWAWY